jgi:hypothetical protein
MARCFDPQIWVMVLVGAAPIPQLSTQLSGDPALGGRQPGVWLSATARVRRSSVRPATMPPGWRADPARKSGVWKNLLASQRTRVGA